MAKKSQMRRSRLQHWEKLDNTANLFPAIATNEMTNVYRISAVLQEMVDRDCLQEALERTLSVMDTFHVRLRKGIFWYYFEENLRPAPLVEEEDDYPCRYIEPYANNNYLFRVTYYRKRINLEVFHVLADGMGGINFLRELVYQYLRLKHKELAEGQKDRLSDETSLNTEDSYLKNYRRSHAKAYKTARALEVRGEQLSGGELGVLHGYMPVDELKAAGRKYGASINEFLVAVFIYSIYKEYLHGQPCSKPIASCIPVNLRPYFDSMTTRNFFVMVSAVFVPEENNYTFEEVLQIVLKSLRAQINKEHLEDLFSYNVSNQKNLFLRSIPFFVKKQAMRFVYRSSAKANTTTMTNIGEVVVEEKYQPYIKRFQTMISMSTGQRIKAAICSYQGELVFTFTSTLKDVSIQRCFFRTLAQHEVPVTVESNGVYYEAV